MWSEVIEYLKDSHQVARIQELFGVRIHRNDLTISDDKKSKRTTKKTAASSKRTTNSSSTTAKRKGNLENGIDHSPIRDKNVYETSDEETIPESLSNSPNYTINNHFWYYLFLFGTELGDEIFYSTFIPFWFWNIDGAVGRRIVLVWAVVMTIGNLRI